MGRKLKKTPQWLYITLALLLAALLLVLFMPVEEEPSLQSRISESTDRLATLSEQQSRDVNVLKKERVQQTEEEASALLQVHTPESGIALLLDDAGYDLRALKRVLALPFPVAISVLPDAPYAVRAATMAHDAGSVVMLHLPMEPTTPKYRASMSESFLRMDMSESQLRERFESALEKVPYVTGVNNHMGSLLTTLEPQMKWVMEICRERGLFFVDSKTSNNSVAADTASQYGLPWAVRRIFLDHTVDAEGLKMAWAAALRCAEQRGSCIVIAHPHAETLDFLEQQIAEEDYHFFRPITSMLHRRH